MALTIDRRERSLIQLLPEASIETLDVGDVWCRLGDGVISFVVERKRVDDFAASIIDGRWHEQKSRLLALGCAILFVIEGDFRAARLPYEQLLGACAAAITRDACYVFRTMSLSEFAQMIKLLVKHACATSPVPTLGISKRKRDEESVFVRMIMAIPSFSEHVARAIAAHFGSVSALQDALRDLKHFPPIRISASASLGKARIKRLCVAFA